ncbi:MAG: hypothetical protein GYB37_09475, partial [Algicola sp.]|nr:hypothetical protein [Algicola sp.]
FIYKEFQKDMIEATKDFVLNTDYEIEDVSDYAIRLCNGKKRIIFTLEAFNLLHQIENVDGSSNMSIYELFEKEGIMNEYPKISIPKF